MSKVNVVKKVKGKDGKFYYYESSLVEDVKKIYWYKTDKSFGQFLIDQYKSVATKIEYNEEGEIIYMEYPQQNNLPEGISGIKVKFGNDELKKEKNKNGCLSILVLGFIIIVLALTA